MIEQPDFATRKTISAEAYRAADGASSSQLKHVLRSPAHYKYELENPSEPTRSQELGTLIHLAVLEPERFLESAVTMPKFSGTGSRAAQAEFLKANEGLVIVSEDERAVVEGVLKSLGKNKTARELLRGGAAEESFFWRDSSTGLSCKARPDYIKPGLLVDVKSTTNASPHEFSRQVANMMYHLQAAFYLDGVSDVLGERMENFALVVVEKTAPFAVATYMLDDATIDVGRMQYRKALRTLAECKRRNRYPGYPDRLTPLAIPSWAWPLEDDFGLRVG